MNLKYRNDLIMKCIIHVFLHNEITKYCIWEHPHIDPVLVMASVPGSFFIVKVWPEGLPPGAKQSVGMSNFCSSPLSRLIEEASGETKCQNYIKSQTKTTTHIPLPSSGNIPVVLTLQWVNFCRPRSRRELWIAWTERSDDNLMSFVI